MRQNLWHLGMLNSCPSGLYIVLFTPVFPSMAEHVGEAQKLNVINFSVGKVCLVCPLFWTFVLTGN